MNIDGHQYHSTIIYMYKKLTCQYKKLTISVPHNTYYTVYMYI